MAKFKSNSALIKLTEVHEVDVMIAT